MSPEKIQVLIELLKQGDGASKASSDLKSVEAEAKKADQSLISLKKSLAGLAATVGLSAIVKDVILTNARFEALETTLKNVTGSTAAADKEFKFIHDTANRLGADLEKL